MVCFAFGTITADALLHMTPHLFGKEKNDYGNWILGGIYLFLLIEFIQTKLSK